MTTDFDFDGWDGSVADARARQTQLAAGVVLEDRLPPEVRMLAGFDVGFEDEGRTTRAAAVLLDADRLAPIECHVARVPTSMHRTQALPCCRMRPAWLRASPAAASCS